MKDEKKGLEAPVVKEYNKLKIGFIIFVLLVLVILGIGLTSDIFGVK